MIFPVLKDFNKLQDKKFCDENNNYYLSSSKKFGKLSDNNSPFDGDVCTSKKSSQEPKICLVSHFPLTTMATHKKTSTTELINDEMNI